MISTLTLYRISQEVMPFYGPEIDLKYKYNDSGKLLFLQRACFWVLRKLGCQIQDTSIIHTRTQVDLDDLFQDVMDNTWMMNMIYNKEAKYIIVGKDYYVKYVHPVLMHDQGYMQFQVPPTYEAKVKRNGVRMKGIYMGLNVIMVPWIDGMFCLPEID